MTTLIQEVTRLYPVEVQDVFTPTSLGEIQDIIRTSSGKISFGGGRYSMGGQTAVSGGIQIDMRSMNRVLDFQKEKKEITVEAGITWRDIQDYIDPHDLSVMTMQTYSNFTVGGSLSVNVHGRYIGFGPIILSVKSIRIVLADGTICVASREENSDIFYGAIGGYGGIGLIVDATLMLKDNVMLARSYTDMPIESYKDWFFKNVRDNRDVIFHNADIYPPHFSSLRATSWSHTHEAPTINERLIPRGLSYSLHQKVFRIMTQGIGPMTHFDYGKWFRKNILDPIVYRKEEIHSRNYEASYDVAELEPKSREKDTYVLEEYFCPVDRFDEFIYKMREIFERYDVNVINVSIRHALSDDGSLLAWAKEEVFAFVIYYNQGTSLADKREVAVWTRELIDVVISLNGRYYLPYQLHGTHTQIRQAYTGFESYISLKKKYDPEGRFSNMLLEKYYYSDPEKDIILPSRFKTIFSSVYWRDRFYIFLQNIFHIAPTGTLHSAIWDIVEKYDTDEEIYKEIQKILPTIKPHFADIRYGLPALRKQKTEMARQASLFLRQSQIEGYIEIGGAGRYIAPIQSQCHISGPVYLISDEPIDSSPVRILERGQITQYNTKCLTYTPHDFSHIPDASVDCIIIFIGLHHCPIEQLDEYVTSFSSKLRRGGHLILRDHNVEDIFLHTLVELAHDIYNAGTGIDWHINAQELRNFRSIVEWIHLLSRFGYKKVDENILQEHDPTDNTLMHFIKE